MTKINTPEGIRIFFNREFYPSVTPHQSLIEELKGIEDDSEKEAFLLKLLEFAEAEHREHNLTYSLLRQANPGEAFALPALDKARRLKNIIQEELLKAREGRCKTPDTGQAPQEPGTPAKPQGDKSPLSSLTNRQLALWLLFTTNSGEMDRPEKPKISVIEFAKKHGKNGQRVYEFWLEVNGPKRKRGKNKPKDIEKILPHLEQYPKALKIAEHHLSLEQGAALPK